MNTIEEHFSSINAKLQLVLKKYALLQKENAMLHREIERSKENEKEILNKMNLLELQSGILKASAGKMKDDEKRDFEKKINQFIKDLDKCMAILNN